MRPALACLAALPLVLAAAEPARAQVTTNRGALDALNRSGHHATATTTRHAATPPPRHGHAASGRGQAHAAHPQAVRPQAVRRPVAATIPAAPPPPPVFTAPVINVPLHPPAPPPPVPVVQTAAGAATPMPDGLRIGFGTGSADLNPATMQALQGFAGRLRADPTARADLDAYSTGTADDPSTPRRMALSRGLAARAVLINAGIPSTRIYVRAFGQAPAATGPSVSPDRVDLHLSRNADSSVPAGPAPVATPAPATP